MRRAFSFLAGLLTGALVGSVLALLLTPSSGETLRANMRNTLEGLQQEIRQAAQTRRAELQRQLDALRQRSSSGS
jgi:gas vesicle protein